MFKKIMLALDLEHKNGAEKAVKAALDIGGEKADEVIFQVLTVIPALGGGFVSSFLPKNYGEQMEQKIMDALHEFTRSHFPTNSRVKHIVAHGIIYDEINRLAKEQNSDLIIIVSGKPGSSGLGPNAARVARYSDKPVLVIR